MERTDSWKLISDLHTYNNDIHVPVHTCTYHTHMHTHTHITYTHAHITHTHSHIQYTHNDNNHNNNRNHTSQFLKKRKGRQRWKLRKGKGWCAPDLTTCPSGPSNQHGPTQSSQLLKHLQIKTVFARLNTKDTGQSWSSMVARSFLSASHLCLK